MKHLMHILAFTLLGAGSALAGAGDISLPRMDFPVQGGEMTQGCNLLPQTCAQD